jgi:hypothetical protein
LLAGLERLQHAELSAFGVGRHDPAHLHAPAHVDPAGAEALKTGDLGGRTTGLAPQPFPLVKADWVTQQRSAARARAAGMPATPLEVTVAHVLAWDTERGEPPLTRGFSPEAEQALLAQAGHWERRPGA